MLQQLRGEAPKSRLRDYMNDSLLKDYPDFANAYRDRRFAPKKNRTKECTFELRNLFILVTCYSSRVTEFKNDSLLEDPSDHSPEKQDFAGQVETSKKFQ